MRSLSRSSTTSASAPAPFEHRLRRVPSQSRSHSRPSSPLALLSSSFDKDKDKYRAKDKVRVKAKHEDRGFVNRSVGESDPLLPTQANGSIGGSSSSSSSIVGAAGIRRRSPTPRTVASTSNPVSGGIRDSIKQQRDYGSTINGYSKGRTSSSSPLLFSQRMDHHLLQGEQSETVANNHSPPKPTANHHDHSNDPAIGNNSLSLLRVPATGSAEQINPVIGNSNSNYSNNSNYTNDNADNSLSNANSRSNDNADTPNDRGGDNANDSAISNDNAVIGAPIGNAPILSSVSVFSDVDNINLNLAAPSNTMTTNQPQSLPTSHAVMSAKQNNNNSTNDEHGYEYEYEYAHAYHAHENGHSNNETHHRQQQQQQQQQSRHLRKTNESNDRTTLRVRSNGTYQPPTKHVVVGPNRIANSATVPDEHIATASGSGAGNGNGDAEGFASGYKYYDSISDPHHQSHDQNYSMPQSRQHYANGSAVAVGGGDGRGDGDGDDGHGMPPLMEIPEDVYAVRKAALQVLKPLTKTWLIVSVGFAMTVLFAMSRWTRLLPHLPFWFILMPSWLSHVGLFWCHIMSAKALSLFIAEANDSRQRPDSRDHLDRTEYLPLLQRSLKFGFKTGCISFGFFLFEILLYLRLIHHNRMSLCAAFFPLWIIVIGGILDGIVCKTQHFVRVLCWVLVFGGMIFTVLKVDFGFDDVIRWRYIVAPVVSVLAICSGSLIYIIHGHQVGYFRLTESQLTAGNLYSLSALLSMVLVVILGEVIPMAIPMEIETKLLVVILAPMVVTLLGMGAWVVSRDEYGRLLLYGGQAAVHPRKLRWKRRDGWTSVQGKGVTNIPMFGEVSFQPLRRTTESQQSSLTRLTACCGCYPYEETDVAADPSGFHDTATDDHPYLSSEITQPHLGGGQGATTAARSATHINTLPTYNNPTV